MKAWFIEKVYFGSVLWMWKMSVMDSVFTVRRKYFPKSINFARLESVTSDSISGSSKREANALTRSHQSSVVNGSWWLYAFKRNQKDILNFIRVKIKKFVFNSLMDLLKLLE